MHHRMTQGLLRSNKILQDTQQTNSTKSFSNKKDTTKMHTTQTSPDVSSSPRRELPLTVPQYMPRKRCKWSTMTFPCIWWDYSFWLAEKRRPFDSQTRSWIFKPPVALWCLDPKMFDVQMGQKRGWGVLLAQEMQCCELFHHIVGKRATSERLFNFGATTDPRRSVSVGISCTPESNWCCLSDGQYGSWWMCPQYWQRRIEGISSERSWTISTLVWWKVEEYNGKRLRKQEKISIL